MVKNLVIDLIKVHTPSVYISSLQQLKLISQDWTDASAGSVKLTMEKGSNFILNVLYKKVIVSP